MSKTLRDMITRRTRLIGALPDTAEERIQARDEARKKWDDELEARDRDEARRKFTDPDREEKARSAERLAALEMGTTQEDVDKKLMDAHERAEGAAAASIGLAATLLLERIDHAKTKRELWRERYGRASEKLEKLDREIEDLNAEHRGYR